MRDIASVDLIILGNACEIVNYMKTPDPSPDLSDRESIFESTKETYS